MKYRISSAAFILGSDGTISVDLEESLQIHGVDITLIYKKLDRAVALVAHTIETYRSQKFSVIHEPVINNDHHGSVSTTQKNKALRRAARKLADYAEFVVGIDPDLAVKFGASSLRM